MTRILNLSLPGFAACLLIGCQRAIQAPVIEVDEQKAEIAAEPAKSYSGSIEPLNAYLGKELAKLDKSEAEKLLTIIKKAIPDREYHVFFDFRPWYVWEFPNNGHPVLVLLEVNNQMPHPGSTGIRINVFEKTQKARSESVFDTGHRCYMRVISLEKQEGKKDPFIVIETGSFHGSDYRKQTYARIDGRFDLIRIEDSEGKVTRNNYYVNHFACGPAVPKQTPAEWEADIASADRPRILRALVWLGGAHWEGKPPDESDKQLESIEQIRLVHEVRSNQKVVDRLQVLRASEDLWLKEAASLAADPKDGRW